MHSHIFTDGSVNTQLKIGYGAYFMLSDLDTPTESVRNIVTVKRFEQTSSTKLELQILLWALEEAITFANGDDIDLTAYTDSQNIIDLPTRQTRLEQNNYFSSKNKRLNNYELYQEFYHLTSKMDIKFIKMIGHQPSIKKDKISKLFSLVDKASRQALREEF